jgi:RND superfamily putative drug exporter
MFEKLGQLNARFPIVILLAWALFAGALAWVAPAWEDRCQDDDLRFLPSRCLSVQGHQLFKEAFPKELYGSKVIYAFERRHGTLTQADLALVDRLAAEAQATRDTHPELLLGQITSPRDPLIGSRYLSDDRHCALLSISIESPFLAFRTAEALKHLDAQFTPLIEAHRQEQGDDEVAFHVAATGPAAIGHDLNAAAYSSLDGTTCATFLLVVIILLLIYRAPLLVVVPLITIGGSVWMALRMLALFTLLTEIQLVNITRVFVVVVLFGAGTDYCLFLISRYREELLNGQTPGDAIRQSLRRVGGALTASAATVVCGLGMMACAEFSKLRYSGPAIAISLLVALAASLTLAPAMLRLLGAWAFWPQRLKRAPGLFPIRPPVQEGDAGFWHWVSGKVAAYPGCVLAGSMVLILPLAWLGWKTESVFDITAELPRAAESRAGMDIIRRHFTPGELGPLTVLIQTRQDWNSAEGRKLIADLTEGLSKVPNVAEVRSLTRPLGKDTPGNGLLAAVPQLADLLIGPKARKHYLAALPSGNVARFDVVMDTEPFAPQSVTSLRVVQYYLKAQLKEKSLEEARCAYYGITPLTHDIADVHQSDRLLVNGLTLAGILVILLFIVRKPLLAIYLLATVLVSYYATIGAAELLTWGWLDSEVGKIDWKVPFFLFTILVAIGEDYNIFLMARVLEEARKHGMWAGTQRALARTGGTITSCGLIMAGTFATMLLCSLATLAQMGLALAFGVLLDTFVVRPILVPAMLLLIHRQPKAAAEPGPVEVAGVLRKSA